MTNDTPHAFVIFPHLEAFEGNEWSRVPARAVLLGRSTTNARSVQLFPGEVWTWSFSSEERGSDPKPWRVATRCSYNPEADPHWRAKLSTQLKKVTPALAKKIAPKMSVLSPTSAEVSLP
jgi:hypothetical protein